ncbi:MAG: hypothetical protein P8X42_03485 [Calditrichaceae bacterium]
MFLSVIRTSILSIVFSFLFTNLVTAQSNLKNNLFDDYRQLIEKAREKNAEILSPENFEKAVEKFDEADQNYDQNKSGGLKEIRKKLDESKQFAEKALSVVELANLYLKTSIDARQAALAANAPLHALSLWKDAEDKMRSAGLDLEDDEINDARENGDKASALYREAELKAIKNGILGEAREEIKLAENADADEYSYQTLMDAKNSLHEAEQLIESDPYDRADALAKAQQAAYQGRHAKYLANTIKKLSKKDENWESLILKFEDLLIDIAQPLNATVEFDEGFDKPVREIQSKISELMASEANLREERDELQNELSTVKELDADKTAQLEKQKILNEKIEQIKSMFTTDHSSLRIKFSIRSIYYSA